VSELVPVLENTRTLADCEAVIRRGLNSFIEVGEALMEIRDNRLYREKGFGRFEDYCQQEWGFSQSRTYQMMDAAKVTGLLESSTIVEQLPSTERQARELVPLMRQDVIEMVDTLTIASMYD